MTARALDVGETCPRCRSRVWCGEDGYGCGCDRADDDGQSEDEAWADWWAIRCAACGMLAVPIAYDGLAKPTRYQCRSCRVETSETSAT